MSSWENFPLAQQRQEQQAMPTEIGRQAGANVGASAGGEWDRFPRAEYREFVPPQADPTEGGSTLQLGFSPDYRIQTGIPISQGANRFLIGAGKAISDLLLGSEQAARALVPGISKREAELAREAGERRIRDQPIMETGAGMAGNIAGNIAATLPTALIPGAGTYAGAAGIGGALGAMQPVAEGESRIGQTAMGAAGGAAGRALAGAASRILSPRTNEAVEELLSEDVRLTPGQIAGGGLRRFEEGIKSVPFTGDLIRSSERRAMEDWNRATIDKVLAPIGKKSIGAGRVAVKDAYKKVTNAYDDLVPKLNVVADEKFPQDIGEILAEADIMTDARKQQLINILQSRVLRKMSAGGQMSGRIMKEVDSDLGRLARQYMKAQDPDQRHLGDALYLTQMSLRNLVKRNNPQYDGQIEDINRAYAMLLRVENAAAQPGAKEGVFSPANLNRAVRSMESSMRKRRFAHGTSLMQEGAERAESVLGATVPDSGTPFRAASLGALGGAAYIDPTVLGSFAASGAPYTRAGRAALELGMTRRPELLRQGGNLLELTYPVAGGAGAGLTIGSQN